MIAALHWFVKRIVRASKDSGVTSRQIATSGDGGGTKNDYPDQTKRLTSKNCSSNSANTILKRHVTLLAITIIILN
jgi:hypothetical protein